MLPCGAKDVYVTVTPTEISQFIEPSLGVVCFRCGCSGHMRSQCFTYKVKMCWNVSRCRDPKCTYAHSLSELRTPWKLRCVRVVKQNGRYVCLGCNSCEHSFRRCPIHRDLMYV